jgi:hypothetical protein
MEGSDRVSLDAGQAGSAWSRALSVVAAVGPPVTVATALLIYFGWARADAQAQYMGLNATLFGYSTQDFVLISVSSLFLPLIMLLVAGILWRAIDAWLRRRSGRPLVNRLGTGALLGGLLLGVVTLILILALPERNTLFGPYVLALAVLIAAWGARLRRLDPALAVPAAKARAAGTGEAGMGPAGAVSPSARSRAGETAMVFALVTLLLFWGTANYAQALGRAIALSLEHSVTDLPQARVYSSTPLGIGAPNVTEVQLGTPATPLYRYDGLRLLVLSGGRFFLLHNGWTSRAGTVVVLPDNTAIRLEFSR